MLGQLTYTFSVPSTFVRVAVVLCQVASSYYRTTFETRDSIPPRSRRYLQLKTHHCERKLALILIERNTVWAEDFIANQKSSFQWSFTVVPHCSRHVIAFEWIVTVSPYFRAELCQVSIWSLLMCNLGKIQDNTWPDVPVTWYWCVKDKALS